MLFRALLLPRRLLSYSAPRPVALLPIAAMSSAATKGSTQPPWQRPTKEIQEPVLKVYNSLTRAKDEFIPVRGRRVDWYNCGPTVYDASHMGHARNYLTQDIIRRILRDYFNYDVNFVMNVTDIDDKIILRARELHLLSELKTTSTTLNAELLEKASFAFASFYNARLDPMLGPEAKTGNETELEAFDRIVQKEKDAAWAKEMREKHEKFAMYVASLTVARGAIGLAQGRLANAEGTKEGAQDLIEGAKEVLGPWLGETLADTIQDPRAVSRSLAATWETAFFDDMAKLNVLPPDTITRVSEYVPEIVAYVDKIVHNGFAYEAEGSVWFDVAKFEGAKAKNGDEWAHEYAKLQPGSKGNKKLLDEGEGALTGSKGKRSSADFALWKAKSKPGEPSWPSPWGEGRPGWHIECSVMASEVLGQGMDIHSGGVDLMFPHHDNELAQSEAYHDCRQWVNYFLHTGHLHIEGLKMSKSLKNFITIEDALRDNSARQLRMAFMLQTWNAKMDFKRDALADVRNKEDTFDNFFTNVKAKMSESAARAAESDGKHHYEDKEQALMADLHQAQDDFRSALCDSFNTSAALSALLDVVAKTNIYFSARGASYNIAPVQAVALWVTRMLRMFGLGEGPYEEGVVGWGKEGEAAGGGDFEAKLDKYLRALAGFRDDVRKLAIAGAANNDILALCDRFRDQDLVNLGVALDDGQGADGGALYKLYPPETLIKQREEKAQAAADKLAKKAAAAAALEAKRIAALEKGRLAPVDMFKPPNVPEGTYSAWDDAGLPTLDGEGNEVAKSAGKRLLKEWKAQEKAHAAWVEWQKAQ